jgi:hypothetical protein
VSWQKRDAQKYYYRSRREGRRVTHDYFGTVPLASVLAQRDAEERERKQAEVVLRNMFRVGDDAVRRLMAACKELLQAVLLGEGFHQYDRGPWKRRTWTYVRRQQE